jgi:hypothetical protein
MALLRRSGDVTFLRAHRLGGRFGPPQDQIDVEFVAKVSGARDHSFGNTLRNDDALPSHQAMFELLRDGLIHSDDLETTVDYDVDIDNGQSNGILWRVELRPK